MADVAQLGIAVDSSQVKSATAALNQLNQASVSAQKGADNLTEASRKAGPALSTVESMARRAGVSVEEMQKRVDAASMGQQKLAAASQPAVKGIIGLANATSQASNDNAAYSKSAQKVIDNLAMEEVRLRSTGREWAITSALRKAGVDANSAAGKQIAEAAGRVYDLDKATDKTNSTLEKFSSRFVKGLIAGAAITAVQQLTQYLFNLNTAIATTADTADRAGVSYAKIQGLTTAAGYKGLGSDQLNAGIISFNQQLDLARNGIGSLQTLLRSNGQTVSDTATSFGKVADLVMAATGNTRLQFSILQQAGLPATREWAKFMEQGSAAINKAADASTKLSDQQLREAKAVNDKWNEYWTNFENWGKRAAVNVLGALSGIGSLGAGPQPERAPYRVTIPTGDASSAAKPAKPPFDPELAKQQISLEQQRLSILGPLATVQDQVRAKQLELNAAGLNNVSVSKAQRDALLNLTRAQAELAQIQAQAQIGVFNLGKASEQAGHELQGWIDRKLLDPSNAQQMAGAQQVLAKRIEQTADAARVAAAPLEGLQRLGNEAGNLRGQIDTFATGSLNYLSDALVSIGTGAASAGDAFKNFGMQVVTALQKMIVQLTIIQPLASSLQSAFGGSGLLSALGLGGAGGTASVATGLGAPFPMFAAAGGGTFGPGWGVVGERGPELIKVNRGSVTVVPNHISKPYLPGFAEGGTLSANGMVSRGPWGRQDNGPQQIVNNYDFRGADPSMKGWVKAQIKVAQDQTLKAAPGYTAKVSRDRPGMRGRG